MIPEIDPEPAEVNQKYVVLRRDRLAVGDLYGVPLDAFVDDGVVIRRQDLFASPALGVYAQTIGMVAKSHPDPIVRKRLQSVADYFDDQSALAADTPGKLPD